MKRLTTDAPDGNFENMLNFVYSKGGRAYIRHDGMDSDVPLTEWAKRQCALQGCDVSPKMSDEEADQELCDCMMDAYCPTAMAYCFASQAVHVRDRLKLYEDTGLMPEEVSALSKFVMHGQWQGEDDGYADGENVYDVWRCSRCGYTIEDGIDDPRLFPNYCPNCGAKMDGGEAIILPPNAPLTLEELREMDGEPVWAKCLQSPDLSCWGYHDTDEFIGYHANFADGNYGKVWLAYRRKPEAGL